MAIKQRKHKGAFNLHSKQVTLWKICLGLVSQLVYIRIASTRFSKAAASFTISEVGLGCLKEAWKKKKIKKS